MTKDELATMEPFERLQHREWERQQLLEELKQKINGLESDLIDSNPEMFRRLTLGTLAVFLGREIALEAWPENQSAYGRVFASLPEASSLFRDVLMPQIRLFTKSEIERYLIVADLLEYVISSFTQHIRTEFLRITVHERKKFFKKISYPTNGCQ